MRRFFSSLVYLLMLFAGFFVLCFLIELLPEPYAAKGFSLLFTMIFIATPILVIASLWRLLFGGKK